ncbi:SEC-C metal-binding domain-containing protein [Actinomadura scrupuli]|uniref:SEC-C metal-binding domain-containing protein n=1 Tax=Actinomadura scrupuli TaxID=559629 RepID=UPI003D955275
MADRIRLTDDHFQPLDLEEVLDAAYEDGDEEAVLALMERALSDPRAEGDPELAVYLEELADLYVEAARYDEAIATEHRILDLDLDAADRTRGFLRIAGFHARAGRDDEAMRVVRSVLGEEDAKSVTDREFNVYADAARTVGEFIGDTRTAVGWLETAITEAMTAGLRPARFMFLDQVRRRLVTASDPGFDAAVEEYAEQARQAAAARAPAAVQVRVPYFPAADFAEAGRSELLGGTHEDHRREVERSLRGSVGRGGAAPGIALIEVPGLLAFAEEQGHDPAQRETWQAYAEGDGITLVKWPPGRNEDCWCGSGRKYKKCCGAPTFAPPADPAG